MPRRRSRKVTVGLVKAVARWGKPDRNLALLERATRGLEAARLDILVTPECFLDGYMVRDRKRCTRAKLKACAVSGPADERVRRAARVARSLGCYMVFGASELGSDGRFRNMAYLLDRRGEHVGTYQKVHTDRRYEPGGELPIFPTDFGVIGIMICADRRWPENARVLRLKGAELILNPTWGFYGDLNTAIMRVRAYENGVPVCFAHPRQALRPGVLVHEVDLKGNVPATNTPDRASSHPVQNRRPDLYGPIAASDARPKGR